jgi:hypothetical protein
MTTQTKSNIKVQNWTSLHKVSAKVAWKIISTRYAWMAFFLFKILDHACTTCFVLQCFGNSFSKSFANSQRYMKKILGSIFKI